MLIAKGYDVAFKMKSGKLVRAPRSYGMLHDPSGKDWPKTSVLVAPFSRTRDEVRQAEAEKYFGYVPRRGALTLPGCALQGWQALGEVQEIDYWRPGEHQAEYFHPFRSKGWIFSTKELPKLYRCRRLLRLELGPGAVLNWRGFVYP